MLVLNGRRLGGAPLRSETPSAGLLAHSAWLLLALLALGLAVRVALLLGPFGQIEADEAIVGLMARHILHGDRPFFYWGQAYLGTLEPFTAAAVFAVVGPSTLALKAVPTAYSLVFIVLGYLTARRLFGAGPALLSAGYLALPPFFLGLWSTKPRGGYIEFLVLGQATLLAALWAAEPKGRPLLRGPAVLALGALAIWTHPLAVVYVLPALLFVALRRRDAIPPWLFGLVALGAAAAMAVLLRVYLANRLPGSPSALEGLQLSEGPLNIARLLRIGGAVLVGLAQGTTSPGGFEADWPTRLGSSYLVTALLALGVLGLLIRYAPSLRAVVRHDAPEWEAGPALLLAVLVLTPLVIGFSSFGQKLLIIEPRYALPLYSVVPLAANEVWRLQRRPALLAAVCVAVLALNAWSWATAEPRLNLPSTIGPTTPRTRAELETWLEGRGLGDIYTNYWLAYPITFESDERIIPSVIADGFNRYIPYAYWVSVAERPAWVFVADGGEERAFQTKLAAAGASRQRAVVCI
jgi:hypothetical protein